MGAAGRVDGRVEGDLLRVPVVVLALPHHPLVVVLVQLLVRRDVVLLQPPDSGITGSQASSDTGDRSPQGKSFQ